MLSRAQPHRSNKSQTHRESGWRRYSAMPPTSITAKFQARYSAPINPEFDSSSLFECNVSGLTDPRDIAFHGGYLFVSDNQFGANSIGFVNQIDPTSGAFFSGTNTEFRGGPRGIAFVGGNMRVAESFANHINKYDPVTLELIDIDFISDGLSGPEHIAVAGVPESGPGLLLFGAILLSLHFLRRRIVVG
jgi:hypothetical protein